MKKIVLSATMLAIVATGFAQKSNISKTKDALWEPVDLVAAKSAIESALNHPDTKNLAETHKLAGDVYFKILEAENDKAVLGSAVNKDLQKESVIKSVDEYLVAYKLDQMPNDKGKIKPRYQKDIEKNLKSLSLSMIQVGNTFWTDKDYNSTVAVWGKYLDLPKVDSKLFGDIAKDTLYNDIYYYTINAALLDTAQASSSDLAINMMENFKTTGHPSSENVAQWLYSTYMKKGQKDKALNSLKECSKIFPKSDFFIGTLVNYYIENNQTNEAVSYLDKAISSDPKNTQYHIVKGTMLSTQKKYDEAIAVFQNVINNLDANNATAYREIGAVYASKARDLSDEANKIPLSQKAKYNAKQKEVQDCFKKAQEPLEKSRSLKGDDSKTLTLLRAVYMSLNMGAKANEVKTALDNLK